MNAEKLFASAGSKEVCDRDPMRILEEANRKLRSALEVCVGASTREELLEQKRIIEKLGHGSQYHNRARLGAVNALLETL